MAKAKAKAAVKPAAKQAPAKVKYPEKFTITSIIDAVATMTELPKKKAKEVIEAYLDVVSAGVLSGARVPLGQLGRLFIKEKPATPKKKGRNPQTGEEMIIPAKPARKVPRATFGKAFKELCKKAKVKK
ncbi:MAG TPA: HU family DNA-binding protein [bacterium]|nr:HU family DNA-binding protein [bacterium]